MIVIIALLFLVLLAISLVAISFGYRFLEKQRKKQVEDVLETVSGPTVQEPETNILKDVAAGAPLEEMLIGSTYGGQLQRMLSQAGLPWSLSRLFFLTTLAALAGATLGFVIRPLGFVIGSALVGMVLFGVLPYAYVRRIRAKRLSAFEEQFPEALDFMGRSMRAGHAFTITLEMLGSDSPEPLGHEFRTLFHELNLGAPLEAGLADLCARVPLLDVQLFASSVLLQKQTGGNLAEIMLRLAFVIRERFRLRGHVKSMSAHGRMTALVLSFMPLVMIVAMHFIAPGYEEGMANDPDGKWLIVAAIFGQVVGYYFMRRITDIKV